MAIPVAVLSFGMQTDGHLKALLDKEYPDWQDCAFDLRQSLRDPLGQDRVSHLQNGTDDKTVVAVVGQAKWADVATDIVTVATSKVSSDKAGLLIVLYCTKGQHRSDTTARCTLSQFSTL